MHPFIAQRIVPQSNQSVIVHKKRFNTQDIMDLIKRALPLSVEQTRQLALKLRGTSTLATLQNIFRFLKSIRYQVDPEGVQIVPLPSKILTDNRTDCKGLAIITHGILTNLGIPHSIRFAKYSDSANPSEFTHVYVVVPDGNRYYTIDAVADRFNHEFGNLTAIQDIPFTKQAISGWFSDAVESVKDWYQGSDVDKALESAQDKVKDALASFRSSVQSFWSKAQERAEKVWQAIKKFGPVTVAIRNSFLLLVQENVFNLAGKLGYASASEQEAVNNGWDPQEYANAKAVWEKVKNAWIVFGGNVDSLIKNINEGKVKKPKLSLGASIGARSPYVGETVTLSAVLASASAIIAVLKPLLDMIRPTKGALPPGAGDSQTPPYIPEQTGPQTPSSEKTGSGGISNWGKGLAALALGFGVFKIINPKS